MTRILLYGYCVGIFSSRKLEKATYEQVPVRYLAADQHPDHDTIAAFGQQHLEALSRLYQQTSRLSHKAGLVLSQASKHEREAAKKRLLRASKLVEKPSRQYNLTDPDSRVMRDGGVNRFGQCSNTQLVLDGHAQVIVAAAVTQEVGDRRQLQPMLGLTSERTGATPAQVTADAGYWNTSVIENEKQSDLFVCPDAVGQFAGEPAMQSNPIAQAMRSKLSSEMGKAVYRLRRTVVEPVFGQIIEAIPLSNPASSLDRLSRRPSITCNSCNFQ